MEINVKALPGVQVSVLNYCCEPAVWVPGTVLDTDVSIKSGGKYRCSYRVKLDRATTPSRKNCTGALFVTVGDDGIALPTYSDQHIAEERVNKAATEGWTDFTATDFDISEIPEGVGSLVGLERVSFDFTTISDLTPLAGLVNLKQIWIESTKVTDLTPLAGLVNLDSLDISDTEVSDLTPLAGLRNMTTLWVCGSNVTDLSPIQHLIDNGLKVHI